MQYLRGTYRIVFLFPKIGIVIKFPNIMLKKAWKVNQEIIPMISNLPKGSRQFLANFSPRQNKNKNAKTTKAQRKNPSSSAMTAKMESPATSGKYANFCLEWPNPLPNQPPEPTAKSAWLIWYPIPCGSNSGCRKAVNRSVLYGDTLIKSHKPTKPAPVSQAKWILLPPATKYMISDVTAMIIIVPVSGWRMRSKTTMARMKTKGRNPD